MRDFTSCDASIVTEAIHAYAVTLVAREASRDFADVWHLPRTTRLLEDLGFSNAMRGRLISRLRRDLGSNSQGHGAAPVSTIGDLIRTLLPASMHSM